MPENTIELLGNILRNCTYFIKYVNNPFEKIIYSFTSAKKKAKEKADVVSAIFKDIIKKRKASKK